MIEFLVLKRRLSHGVFRKLKKEYIGNFYILFVILLKVHTQTNELEKKTGRLFSTLFLLHRQSSLNG